MVAGGTDPYVVRRLGDGFPGGDARRETSIALGAGGGAERIGIP